MLKQPLEQSLEKYHSVTATPVGEGTKPFCRIGGHEDHHLQLHAVQDN